MWVVTFLVFVRFVRVRVVGGTERDTAPARRRAEGSGDMVSASRMQNSEEKVTFMFVVFLH